MTDDKQQVTLGEVHRLLKRVDGELQEHRQETREEFQGLRTDLSALSLQTQRNTASLGAYGVRLDNLDREMRDIKRPRPTTNGSNGASEGDVKDLIEVARDLKGAVRVGKALWGLLAGGLGMMLFWLLTKGWSG